MFAKRLEEVSKERRDPSYFLSLPLKKVSSKFKEFADEEEGDITPDEAYLLFVELYQDKKDMDPHIWSDYLTLDAFKEKHYEINNRKLTLTFFDFIKLAKELELSYQFVMSPAKLD